MNTYERVAQAIDYIQINFKSQPSLEEVAAHVHLSPFHFQRLFYDWAGVSPKKFLQYLSVSHAKDLLHTQQLSLLDTAFETGLSGSSRLHDLFIHIEGMTPGEYKRGGEGLYIVYAFADSPFGEVLVAATTRGVCHLAFSEQNEQALFDLKSHFPNAHYTQSTNQHMHEALAAFQQLGENPTRLSQIKLHVKGTDFQLKVWESLLKTPFGQFSTYGEIAQRIDAPKAARAVGTAIGHNPVAFLIPCHRVIQASGALGGYHWGSTRKSAIHAWEMAKLEA